jgi:quercetin dioxygenase-like cupin family protein
LSTLVTPVKPQPLWFIDTLAYVHVGGEETDGGYTVVEGLAPAGNMPPLHVHRREDELFHVIEGRLTLFLPGEQIALCAGDTIRAPQDVPHTYRVESDTARWLVICQPAGFDEFVRAVSEAAPREELPPAGRAHDLGAIAAAAAAEGIELLGPPGALPDAP